MIATTPWLTVSCQCRAEVGTSQRCSGATDLVTVTTDVLMYRIRKVPFIETLTGHARAAPAADDVISGYAGDGDVD